MTNIFRGRLVWEEKLDWTHNKRPWQDKVLSAATVADAQRLSGTRLSSEKKQPASTPLGSLELVMEKQEGLCTYLC